MPSDGKLKVNTSIGTSRQERSYTSDYAFLAILNENENGDRWEQSPAGWKGGYGLFKAGISALRAVAEQEGPEAFKRASRAALDIMSILDPALTEEEKIDRSTRVQEFLGQFSPKKKTRTRTPKENPDKDVVEEETVEGSEA